MLGLILLTARPVKAQLAPGDRPALLLTPQNRGDVAEQHLIAVRGIHEDWYNLDRPSALLLPRAITRGADRCRPDTPLGRLRGPGDQFPAASPSSPPVRTVTERGIYALLTYR